MASTDEHILGRQYIINEIKLQKWISEALTIAFIRFWLGKVQIHVNLNSVDDRRESRVSESLDGKAVFQVSGQGFCVVYCARRQVARHDRAAVKELVVYFDNHSSVVFFSELEELCKIRVHVISRIHTRHFYMEPNCSVAFVSRYRRGLHYYNWRRLALSLHRQIRT